MGEPRERSLVKEMARKGGTGRDGDVVKVGEGRT